MMRISKLVVIAVLTGTLGLIGCDSDSGGDAGSGGTAGSGGEGGAGGTPFVCGSDASIDESFDTDSGNVTCDALGTIDVPIEIVLAAKPMGDISGEVDFEVQAQFIISEETVATLGALVQVATIGQSTADVADSEGDGEISVPATVPCEVDFSEDTNGNMIAGPVVVTTPVTAGAWTDIDGSIVLEMTEMTLAIASPVPLPLSTAGDDPACVWDTIPTLTFEAGTGGAGGAGGAGGSGGAGGAG